MIVSGEPLLTPAVLWRALMGRPAERFTSVLPGGRAEHYALGRQALVAGLNLLPPGDVLCPAYICDTVVDAIRAAGRRPRYYALTPGLHPDWARMQPPSGVAAMLLVHYFGFRSDLDTAVRFAAEKGIALIEDSAHALLTSLAGSDAGSRGHMAIYSWRKFLPVATGGALVINDPLVAGPPGMRADRAAAGASGCPEALRQLAKWSMFRSGSIAALRRFGEAVSDERPAINACVPAPPDRYARRVLGVEWTHLAGTARARRHNFAYLAGRLRSLDIGVLGSVAVSQDVPWCLPLLARSADHRDELFGRMLSAGIGAWTWPDLPPDVSAAAHPEAIELAGRTLCLPVHHGLGAHGLERMAEVAAR